MDSIKILTMYNPGMVVETCHGIMAIKCPTLSNEDHRFFNRAAQAHAFHKAGKLALELGVAHNNELQK